MDDLRKQVFDENQSKLQPELRVARDGEEMCQDELGGVSCTLKKGHAVDRHVCHSILGRILQTWSDKVKPARAYARGLPAPPNFDLHDGFDEKNESTTFFRSRDNLTEIKVTVLLRQRKTEEGDWE
jgi:hypothetical protein